MLWKVSVEDALELSYLNPEHSLAGPTTLRMSCQKRVVENSKWAEIIKPNLASFTQKA